MTRTTPADFILAHLCPTGRFQCCTFSSYVFLGYHRPVRCAGLLVVSFVSSPCATSVFVHQCGQAWRWRRYRTLKMAHAVYLVWKKGHWSPTASSFERMSWALKWSSWRIFLRTETFRLFFGRLIWILEWVHMRIRPSFPLRMGALVAKRPLVNLGVL